VTLETVETFSISKDIVAKTEDSLRAAGRDGYELFVLWSGEEEGSCFRVRTAHVPKQISFRRKGGLSVRVEGEALHKLNVWLFEHEETLGAQVHAHPTDAYHSETDDTFPIVTVLGGLSIVVPDFCRGGLFAGSAAYRLSRDGWSEASRPISQLLRVV
jgi:hypothetical protein